MTIDEYWYWICNVKGLSYKKISSLIDYFESPVNVFNAKEEEMLQVKGIVKKDIFELNTSKGIFLNNEFNKLHTNMDSKNNYDLETLYNEGILFIHINHPAYPERLKYIPDKPFSLYVKGKLPSDDKLSVGMVGARSASSYGKYCGKLFAKEFAKSGLQIISGIARGIDSVCMEAAVDAGGSSFAVLGCGVNVVYPPENGRLYEKCMEFGGIISEYPPNFKPMPYAFPWRNRIISGLSDAIAVIEAKDKSGTLITVEHALNQGKDVFAVPGRITDLSSAACNKIISEGAGILNEPGDLLKMFGLDYNNTLYNEEKINYLLAKDVGIIYENIDFYPKTAEEILKAANIEYKKGLAGLMQLEMDGLIYEPSANYFAKQ